MSAQSQALLVGGRRTPVGKYGGALSSVRPDDPVASIPAASVRPGEPPRRPVRARRPLTPQSLVERADDRLVLGGTANRWPDGSYRDVAKHVRSQSLLAAKAFGKLALDSVYLDIKNLDGLRAEVDDAVAVGFDAKVAIHPTQVAVIRDGYAPTEKEIAWARAVLDAATRERGVFQYDGLMVDMPVLRRAERIVALAP